MIIMQTVDALSRKTYVESKELAKVIFHHETDDSVCVQYHPKGIRGTLDLLADGTLSLGLDIC
jgi:hypothetical protein